MRLVRCGGCAGFTLLELLVVISILGILMAFGVGGLSGAKSQAKAAQARQDCAAVKVAIVNFFADYNRYPTSKLEDAVYEPSDDATSGNAEVMRVLTAEDKSLNPRQVVYYDGKTAKKSKASGKYEAGLADGAFFDPWGNTYGVVMDSNYDGKLIYSGSRLRELSDDARRVPEGVGVFSLGRDGQKGILSWQ